MNIRGEDEEKLLLSEFDMTMLRLSRPVYSRSTLNTPPH